MVKNTIISWTILCSLAAQAEVPDPKKWFNESRSQFAENDVYRRYLFLEKKNETWSPINTKDSGLFYNLPSVYTDFQKRQSGEVKISKSAEWVTGILKQMPIDRVGFVEANKVHVYFLRDGKVKQKVLNSKKPIKWKKGHWFRKKLGYDGVVLARKGSFLLIESFYPFKTDAQALSLTDSKKKFNVINRKKRGSALIQLLSKDGFVGVFEIVVADSKGDKISPGTKVLLGTKK